MSEMQNNPKGVFNSTAASAEALARRLALFILIFAAYVVMTRLSSLHFSYSIIPFRLHLSPPLVHLFEHHVWEFAVGMGAIAVFSRGNLWSYGINALNIRQSMYVLWRFYFAALIVIGVVIAVPLVHAELMPSYLLGANAATMVGWIVFEWLATAVADEIFFHGFCQTLIAKYWKNILSVGTIEIPFSVIASTALFTVGRSNVPVYGNPAVEYLFAALLGFYTGMVYYKTRSLLAPMLSQAFFYGMPFVVRYLWMVWK
ncbi:MAG: CPBP family intramembrane metalloprotease [Bacteroidota bacterium]|nr:CPBP family intramembrane metalloprotease [Bacteroidota bacterium]